MATEYEYIYCTQASGSATFSSECYYVEVYHQSGSPIYINIDAAATTSQFPIYQGETLKLYANISSVNGICDTGFTGSLQILGTR